MGDRGRADVPQDPFMAGFYFSANPMHWVGGGGSPDREVPFRKRARTSAAALVPGRRAAGTFGSTTVRPAAAHWVIAPTRRRARAAGRAGAPLRRGGRGAGRLTRGALTFRTTIQPPYSPLKMGHPLQAQTTAR